MKTTSDMEFTTTEAAERLRITRSAVLKLIQRGRLAAVRRGWQWFVAADEVARIAGEDLRTRDGRKGTKR
jgi:excisionase family DNA binding protein